MVKQVTRKSMTPQEKAENLILKYLRIHNDTKEWFHKGMAKQCALIAVDEVLNFIQTDAFSYTNEEYWIEVKQEIKKYER